LHFRSRQTFRKLHRQLPLGGRAFVPVEHACNAQHRREHRCSDRNQDDVQRFRSGNTAVIPTPNDIAKGI